MQPFTRVESTAAPLRIVNVDTDMIVPKQYLKTITRSGLGKALFAESRYAEDGSENPSFPLNRPAYRNAKILIAGDNFGCGSSREHAPWALLDYGFRCVISTSFASIFYNNALKNGVLPVEVDALTLERLFNLAEASPETILTVDLASQRLLVPGEAPIAFAIAAYAKSALLEGRDEIDDSFLRLKDIEAFEARAAVATPWL